MCSVLMVTVTLPKLKSVSTNGTATATNNGSYVLLTVGEEFNYQLTENGTTFLGSPIIEYIKSTR